MAIKKYAEWLPGIAPRWLKGPRAAALFETVGVALDVTVDAAKQAVFSRFPGLAPADALPHLGAERKIERYPADTDDSHRGRVAAAWDLWPWGGTETGMLNAFHAAGFANVTMHAARDLAGMPGEGVWPPDGDTANWSRFWIRIDATTAAGNPFGWARRYWGAGQWNTGTWGSTATRAEVALVRRVVATWKSAHEVCAGIYVDLPGGSRLRWRAR